MQEHRTFAIDAAFEAEVDKLLREEASSAEFDQFLEKALNLSTQGRLAVWFLLNGLLVDAPDEPVRAAAKAERAVMSAMFMHGELPQQEFVEAFDAYAQGNVDPGLLAALIG